MKIDDGIWSTKITVRPFDSLAIAQDRPEEPEGRLEGRNP
jgi:hypothetical protein